MSRIASTKRARPRSEPTREALTEDDLIVHLRRNFRAETLTGVPIATQLAEVLASLIALGAIPSETKLPGMITLSKRLDRDPQTVKRAYTLLQHWKLVEITSGGTYVRSSRSDREAMAQLSERLEAVLADARAAGVDQGEVRGLVRAALERLKLPSSAERARLVGARPSRGRRSG